MIPTGISYGANITLLSKSHSITKLPPANAAHGINILWEFPVNRLMICGIMRPTKPKSPEKLTAAPANTEAQTIIINRCIFI